MFCPFTDATLQAEIRRKELDYAGAQRDIVDLQKQVFIAFNIYLFLHWICHTLLSYFNAFILFSNVNCLSKFTIIREA